jgi:hypothetical protein
VRVSTKPTRRRTAAPESVAADAPTSDAFAAAILRFLRDSPNATVKPSGMIDLGPVAAQLGAEPFDMQLAVERLADRRLVNIPFIEPGTAGGAELTQTGLRWLIEYEGGKPRDVPAAYRTATARIRTADDAPRLPRDQVYGSTR